MWRNAGKGKYHATATECDGIRFHSKGEAARYRELVILEKVGAIRHLVLQPAFPLDLVRWATGEVIGVGKYLADFQYDEYQAGAWRPVTEDFKGTRTPVYKLKKRMVEAQYGITIRETA